MSETGPRRKAVAPRAALMLSADGVLVGTRPRAAKETLVKERHHEAIVETTHADRHVLEARMTGTAICAQQTFVIRRDITKT